MRTPVDASTLPDVLGVPEMCALLGTSRASLYRAMKRPGWLFPPLACHIDRAPRWVKADVLITLNTARSVAPAARRAWPR